MILKSLSHKVFIFLTSEYIENFSNNQLAIKKLKIKTDKIIVGRSLWEDTIKNFGLLIK